jgi:IstB-like ATP binding protein
MRRVNTDNVVGCPLKNNSPDSRTWTVSTIIDELGFVPFDRVGGELLFNLITDRYERRATVVTTNLAFAEWVTVFAGDEKLMTALLDRLAHHATVITTKGKSYRMRKRRSAGAWRPQSSSRAIDTEHDRTGGRRNDEHEGPRVQHPPFRRCRGDDAKRTPRGYGNDAPLEITERFPQPLGNLAQNARFPHSHSRSSSCAIRRA